MNGLSPKSFSATVTRKFLEQRSYWIMLPIDYVFILRTIVDHQYT